MGEGQWTKNARYRAMSDGQRVAVEGQRTSPSPGEGRAVPHHPAGHHTSGCRMEDCLEMLGRGPKGLKTAGFSSPQLLLLAWSLHQWWCHGVISTSTVRVGVSGHPLVPKPLSEVSWSSRAGVGPHLSLTSCLLAQGRMTSSGSPSASMPAQGSRMPT